VRVGLEVSLHVVDADRSEGVNRNVRPGQPVDRRAVAPVSCDIEISGILVGFPPQASAAPNGANLVLGRESSLKAGKRRGEHQQRVISATGQ
jgi:hypothetical protein